MPLCKLSARHPTSRGLPPLVPMGSFSGHLASAPTPGWQSSRPMIPYAGQSTTCDPLESSAFPNPAYLWGLTATQGNLPPYPPSLLTSASRSSLLMYEVPRYNRPSLSKLHLLFPEKSPRTQGHSSLHLWETQLALSEIKHQGLQKRCSSG